MASVLRHGFGKDDERVGPSLLPLVQAQHVKPMKSFRFLSLDRFYGFLRPIILLDLWADSNQRQDNLSRPARLLQVVANQGLRNTRE